MLRRRLLRWYDQNARDLPWRGSKDPYAIWVSEIMLQQTRVDVVRPYFARWMARFPSVAALAAASDDDVLRAWSGLGYYRRARNLHAAARQLATKALGNGDATSNVAAGRLPTTAVALRALPGIGAYTSAAIASMAFGEPVAAVDGNVERVIARLALRRGSPKDAANRKRTAMLAQDWLAPRRAGDWNQAMMDLGATVCTPRNPRCTECPVQALCAAAAAGQQHAIPAPRKRPSPRTRRLAVAVVQDRRGRILLVRNGRDGLLAGLWHLPTSNDRATLADAVRDATGVPVRIEPNGQRARHQFSHQTWDMHVHRATEAAGAPGRLKSDARWFEVARLDEEAIPTAVLAALRAVDLVPARRRLVA